jgi:stage IV sporulation protein B
VIFLKKIINFLVIAAAMTELLLSAVLGTADYFTPNIYTVTQGGKLEWLSGAFTVVGETGSNVYTSSKTQMPKSYKGTLMLYNYIPVKSVDVNVVDETCVIPCGTPFGIKLYANGVVIVGFNDVDTVSGMVNPAKESSLEVGDIISSVDGKKVLTNDELAEKLESCKGKDVALAVKRESKSFTVLLHPVQSEADNTYKAGLWVRDSTAGIGTLTFYNPYTKGFAGLGHGICDSDTQEIMPLLSGEIVPVTINGITKGQNGSPGELRGYFTSNNVIGNLTENIQDGVYGSLNYRPEGKAVKVGMKQDVKTGPVKILTTIDGDKPSYYDAYIEKIDYRDGVKSKNIVLHITDQKLLTQTGGIIQGMSGSPIIQNNMLVGAVTHVFINDPTRGYGIFAENMLAESQSVGSYVNLKAS